MSNSAIADSCGIYRSEHFLFKRYPRLNSIVIRKALNFATLASWALLLRILRKRSLVFCLGSCYLLSGWLTIVVIGKYTPTAHLELLRYEKVVDTMSCITLRIKAIECSCWLETNRCGIVRILQNLVLSQYLIAIAGLCYIEVTRDNYGRRTHGCS